MRKYVFLLFLLLLSCVHEDDNESPYRWHKDITATIFWIGEEGDSTNGYIDNHSSVWDDCWVEHYGGVDSPDERNGYMPSNFVPHENPFYCALPYNDFDLTGHRKKDALSIIPWADGKLPADTVSMCKNRWVEISYNGKSVFAQWEDAGPFGEDDYEYVFGNSRPKNPVNDSAGIDVSPAVRDFLGLSGMDKVNWRFVDEEDVPSGPWLNIVTRSNICWNKEKGGKR